MTREEFGSLKRGDVVQWIDGSLGLVRDTTAPPMCVVVTWETGLRFALTEDEHETLERPES